jgi:hypothetical protein
VAEERGFEPLVPPRKGTAFFETTLIDLRLLLLPENEARGTESSTPSRSAEESCPGGEREYGIPWDRARRGYECRP